jgi:hypothetical protein
LPDSRTGETHNKAQQLKRAGADNGVLLRIYLLYGSVFRSVFREISNIQLAININI